MADAAGDGDVPGRGNTRALAYVSLVLVLASPAAPIVAIATAFLGTEWSLCLLLAPWRKTEAATVDRK